VQQGLTEEMVAQLSDFEAADFTEREKLALRFAERMALAHHQLDDAFFRDLRKVYSDAEILELGMITGQFIGFGRLLAVLDLENPVQPEG
jgi:alkylhydroperoxidase family enzyme